MGVSELTGKAAVAVLIVLVAGVLRDRRGFANAVLLGLELALIALGAVQWLARTDDARGRLVLLAVLVLMAAGPFLVAVYLLWNGVTVIRKEGMRPVSVLPLLAGGGILAVTGLVLAVPLAHSGQLALSASVIVLLSGYVSFQCVSFVLYAFFYGCLRVPRSAHFVVVLGCGLLDGGRVSPLLASRLDRGRAVCQALTADGQEPMLIVSGGKGCDEQICEAEAMAGYLTARGFPAGQIVREDRSASTEENLTCTKAVMDRLRPDSTCVIVTSNYHVFRTAMLARRTGVRGQVTGARTASYYWPSATLREFAAVFLSHKAVNLTACALLATLPLTVSLLQHTPT
jgi:uncharacterized SAM-binding protein YcdF (DUF218 family)